LRSSSFLSSAPQTHSINRASTTADTKATHIAATNVQARPATLHIPYEFQAFTAALPSLLPMYTGVFLMYSLFLPPA
jgi:hypothetical protein